MGSRACGNVFPWEKLETLTIVYKTAFSTSIEIASTVLNSLTIIPASYGRTHIFVDAPHLTTV